VTENLISTGWSRAAFAGLAVSITVILVRFVWVFPATYGPRLIPSVRRSDPFPNWRLPFLVSFAGLRGVVSLAAALSIPLTVNDQPFPDRDLVLFTTFCVIAITLVGLGVALPAVVRWLDLARTGAKEATANKRAEQTVRLEGIDAVLHALDGGGKSEETSVVAQSLKRQHADRRAQVATSADAATADNPVADASLLELRLIDVERSTIARAYADNRITDEARRRIERELDLEEARVNHALASMGSSEDENLD
jgi:CPA1 family monovalent cation:H+ antiporter